jgi:hypothetical protein
VRYPLDCWRGIRSKNPARLKERLEGVESKAIQHTPAVDVEPSGTEVTVERVNIYYGHRLITGRLGTTVTNDSEFHPIVMAVRHVRHVFGRSGWLPRARST